MWLRIEKGCFCIPLQIFTLIVGVVHILISVAIAFFVIIDTKTRSSLVGWLMLAFCCLLCVTGAFLLVGQHTVNKWKLKLRSFGKNINFNVTRIFLYSSNRKTSELYGGRWFYILLVPAVLCLLRLVLSSLRTFYLQWDTNDRMKY